MTKFIHILYFIVIDAGRGKKRKSTAEQSSSSADTSFVSDDGEDDEFEEDSGSRPAKHFAGSYNYL